MFWVHGAVSSVLEKITFGTRNLVESRRNGASSNATNTVLNGNERRGFSLELRFHPTCGKAITFDETLSIARRDSRYFEHSVVFSHRPVMVSEIVAVEVLEVSNDFHGPLRIGFTQWDPSLFEDDTVPLGRDMKMASGFWIKSVQLFPITVGSTIYFKIDLNSNVLYGVDGENGGVFLRDVDTSSPLWVVLEAYGSVQSLRFVDKMMRLEDPRQGEFRQLYGNSPPPNILPRRGVRLATNTPLNERRNVFVPPLGNISRSEISLLHSPTSPLGSAPFASPLPYEMFSPGPCIICTEREKNTAFTKCGHICMCYECAEEYKSEKMRSTGRNGSRVIRRRNICPICRMPITSTLRVYL